MEICIMDPPSHFNFGMDSQRTIDPNYNYNVSDDSRATSSNNFPKTQCQGYEPSQSDAFQWRSDSVECKQEMHPMTSMLSSNVQESGSYDSENEQYAYDYDQVPPAYGTHHRPSGLYRPNQQLHQQQRMGPYQLSSSNSQLPSWYNPPIPPESFFPQHSGIYQQQQYAYQQGLVSPSTDPSMRNMIHLSSRYLSTIHSRRFEMKAQTETRELRSRVSVFFELQQSPTDAGQCVLSENRSEGFRWNCCLRLVIVQGT